MIKKVKDNEIDVLTKLAIELWPENEYEELYSFYKRLTINENNACYIYYLDNSPIGFAQCQLRYDYVEGTSSSPVGYLEGIYIKEKYRHHNFAKELLIECEKFSKEKGCKEFASDCELENMQSLNFHKALGFEEVNRIICFKKNI